MALDALTTATAGLRLTQAQIGIVSQNVANAGTAGYVRRSLSAMTTGPGNAGVAAGIVARNFEPAALRQMRLETSGAAYTALNAGVRTQVDALFGTPGDATALDGLVNRFASALQGLTADPSSTAQRAAVIDGASTLAARVGGIAQGVQDLRTAMERQLSDDTAGANGWLSTIAGLNARIQASEPGAKPDLQDQRDQAINALSALMDVTVSDQGDGSVNVVTVSGVTLVDRGSAASLTFDGRGTLSPSAAYTSDASTRGVGTLLARTPGGTLIDLAATGAVRSGSIAAALEMRDQALPQVQRQLDDLAAGLSRAMSDRLATGSAASDGTRAGLDIDLAGLSAGNAITLSLRDASGAQRTLILVPSTTSPPARVAASQTDDPNATVIPFTIPAPSATRDPADIVAAIQAALGSSYSVSSAPPGAPGASAGSVRILANGSAPALLAARASVTQALNPGDTRNGLAQLPLFVDGGRNGGLYTGAFEGGSQLTGFAQRIALNAVVAANPSALVATAATTASGDPTRPRLLYDALTSAQRSFAAGGLDGSDGPRQASVTEFARTIVAAQGAKAASAQSLDEGQGIALATAQGRFSAQAGVDIDAEMSQLIALQTAYTANARVLSAARDMLDMLMRI